MNIGRNLYSWLASEAQSLLLVGLVVSALLFFVERKVSRLIPVIVIGIISILFVFNTEGVKNMLLEIGKKITGT